MADIETSAGQGSLHTRVIGPDGAWRSLNLRELWLDRAFLYILVWRDLKIRYKQTVVGLAWALFEPLVMTMIFSIFLGYLVRVPSDDLPYPVFFLAGFVLWQFFAKTAMAGGQSLVVNRDIVTKLYFPRLLLPTSALFVSFADFVVALVVLFGLMAYFGVAPTMSVLALPLFVVYAALCGFAVGVFGAALNALYRDFGLALPLIIQIWMFSSPVIYPASLVPERFQLIYGLNPMVGIIEGFRWALTGAGGTVPGVVMFVLPLVISVIVLAVGLIFFLRAERTLVDRI
jgi:lipopolysaccharide transport system permease protein